jgi:hypothetical protein
MLRTLATRTIAAATISGRRHCSRPATHSWPARSVLRMMWEALRDGLAAHRRYEELRSWGVAHDCALRQALAIAPDPSERARERISPLCFAGRA